jgi:hypothetical protein
MVQFSSCRTVIVVQIVSQYNLICRYFILAVIHCGVYSLDPDNQCSTIQLSFRNCIPSVST